MVVIELFYNIKAGVIVVKRMMENNFIEPSMQQLIDMRKQHVNYSISPQLSKERLHQMMQVVEEIRLNSNKELL